ncbi:hypothetical protein GCM10023187_21940 [Nibrella viscosa]|uniref:Uncharacterized protein n=1 Tax=Nibrella viscosa TaxID=1084524 RepID=A0ABP8KDX3_9BACT
MKSLRRALLGLLGVAVAGTSLAQEDTKLRRDVTYSTRNYKHPNKAAVASQWEPEASVSFRKRNARRVTIGDYKRPSSRDGRMTGIVLPAQSISTTERNYKAQPARRRAVAKEQPAAETKNEILVEPTGN